MASKPDVQSLFTELQRNYQRNEFEKALKTSNKILQLSPSDDKAFHCKIVCLIQLNKFDDALVQIRKHTDLAQDLSFEKAYCEYRLNRIDESLKTLTALEPKKRTPAANELLAQVHYRKEEFERCYEIYRDQLKNTSDDYEAERETNLSAVLAAAEIWGEGVTDEFNLSEETYEVCYNSACFLIGRNQFFEALEKLQEAERLCVEFFSDDPDATDEDVDSELGVIRAQMGYCHQMLGKSAEATKLYNQVIKQKPSDMALLAVLSNNIVSLNKDQNVFDSKKKIKSATVNGLQHKLVAKQRETIAMNQCLLFMYSNQGEQCRQTATQLQKTYPENETASLIAAAQYAKDKQYDTAVQVLQKQIDASDDDALTLKLSLAQIYLTEAHVDKACQLLKSLPDQCKYSPGIVSALVSLYVNEEDPDAASQVLHEAVNWYSANQPNSSELVHIMKATVDFEMTHGNPEAATSLLEKLRKKDPKDLKILAQLISAYSKFDAQKAEEVSRQLPSPGDMTQGIDADALELSVSSFVPKYIKKSQQAAGSQSPSSPRGGADAPLKTKHKKKKKGKMPKNAEPGVMPDPERWLPLRERSTFRGRRRRNKQRDVGKGTQGSASAATLMAELDINKQGGSAESPRTGPASAPTPGPRQHKPQGAKPKKKKKSGAKW